VLVRYNPSQATRAAVMKTLTDLGYTIHDPEKVKALEEQKRELRQAKTYLLIAAGFTLVSFIFMGVTWTGTVRCWFRWPMMGLALATMFGLGLHIKKKAWQSLRRGILNQHTLLGFGAFAGLTGGFLGFFIPTFPIPDFFGVPVTMKKRPNPWQNSSV